MASTTTDVDQITLRELVIKSKNAYYYLKSKWLTIFLLALIGFAIGFGYAYFKKAEYSAATVFVLDDGNSKGGMSQFAGLASMVGVDIAGSGGSVFSEDNLLELYRSRSIIQKTLLSPFVEGKNQLLIDKYIEINNLRKQWSENAMLKNIQFPLYGQQPLNRLQDSIIGLVVVDINQRYLSVAKPDKKLDIIQVLVTSKDEKFAKCFNNKIVDNVNEFFIQTKIKKSTQNLAILQHQVDSIRAALSGAMLGVANSIDLNPNANTSRQILRVPSQKRQVDVEADKAILTELVKNLEISKAALRKETPLIQVIDQPIYPLYKKKFSKLITGVIGAITAAFVGIIVLIFIKSFKNVTS
jgi:hypothetical protein